jgi:hypothetical protein
MYGRRRPGCMSPPPGDDNFPPQCRTSIYQLRPRFGPAVLIIVCYLVLVLAGAVSGYSADDLVALLGAVTSLVIGVLAAKRREVVSPG